MLDMRATPRFLNEGATKFPATGWFHIANERLFMFCASFFAMSQANPFVVRTRKMTQCDWTLCCKKRVYATHAMSLWHDRSLASIVKWFVCIMNFRNFAFSSRGKD